MPVHVEAAGFETDDGRLGVVVAYRRLEDQQQFEAQPQELEQVFVNLAANARDAMPHGGELRVRVRPALVGATEAARRGLDPGRHVAVDVEDTGAGMPPDVRRQAFAPFFTTKGAPHGTGLGLATVERIVARHDGAVWAESEEGVGTTFRLLLPVHAAAA